MPKTMRVLHSGHEYLLLDERRGGQRTITCMVRADDRAFSGATSRTVVLTKLGNWSPIGVWERDACRPLHSGAEPFLDTLNEIVGRYMEESRRARGRSRRRRFWRALIDSQPVFSMTAAQPHGLAVLVFTSRAKARLAAKRVVAPDAAQSLAGEPAGAELQAVEDLGQFFAEMAEAGFAGAMLDDTDPIYFCTDAEGELHYLRLRFTDEGEIEECVLRPDDSWAVYDGDPDLELYVDQDACDRAMVEHLGAVPFHGFAPGIPLFAIHALGDAEPYASSPSDEDGGCLPIFHDLALAEEYLEFNDLSYHELQPVDDLNELLRHAAARHTVVRLHPDGHRARSASLWLSEDQIILDGFSGFWSSSDGGATYTKCPAP
jgi:hypothetical protein